jgi:hypothetical protein
VPEPSVFKVGVAIEKLRRDKSPGINQIAAALIKAVDRTIRSEINKFILFGIRRNCLRSGRSLSFYLSRRRVIEQNVAIIETYYFVTKFKILSNILLSKLTPYGEEIHKYKRIFGYIV